MGASHPAFHPNFNLQQHVQAIHHPHPQQQGSFMLFAQDAYQQQQQHQQLEQQHMIMIPTADGSLIGFHQQDTNTNILMPTYVPSAQAPIQQQSQPQPQQQQQLQPQQLQPEAFFFQSLPSPPTPSVFPFSVIHHPQYIHHQQQQQQQQPMTPLTASHQVPTPTFTATSFENTLVGLNQQDNQQQQQHGSSPLLLSPACLPTPTLTPIATPSSGMPFSIPSAQTTTTTTTTSSSSNKRKHVSSSSTSNKKSPNTPTSASPTTSTTTAPSKFPCPHCPKLFSRPYNLATHLHTHTSTFPFLCPSCPSRFSRSHDLARHKRTVHGEVRRWKCGFCELSFERRDALVRHVGIEMRRRENGGGAGAVKPGKKKVAQGGLQQAVSVVPSQQQQASTTIGADFLGGLDLNGI
ncbi:hypothetical protein HDV05_002246 [Chytridiales sp. JEL 0842]|nr:hypothetical protein HDV05_002246 [Chytridiales sp. JEL 0842]